jgi:hypothetical protein
MTVCNKCNHELNKHIGTQKPDDCLVHCTAIIIVGFETDICWCGIKK